MYSLLSSIWNIGKIHDRLQLNLCEQESDDCKDESLTSIDSVQEDEIKRIVDIAFKTYDSDNDLLLDFKDFRSFMLDNPSALDFLAHIRQFLNLQLGFAPLRSSEERQLILDIKRSSCMSLGDTYYVLCGKWWRGWSNYVRIDPEFLKELDSKSYSEKIGVIDLVEVKIEEEPLKPGRIDNSLLLKHGTSELNENLIEGDDFVVVDEEIWIAFLNWYGGGPEIPRQVIHAGVEPSPTLLVELYPYDFRIIVNERNNIISSCCVSRCSSIEFLIDKILAEQSMNKENLLVYNLFDENNPVLLNDWSMTLEDARLVKGQLLMFCDQPDHLNAGTVLELDSDLKRLNFESTGSSGVVGLYNLGNTCFMNSAIQCLSLTPLLTQYFLSDFYVKELNRENPLGMKGEVALAYGKLVKQMWMSNQFEVIYPRNLKWIIGKFAPQFLGFQQHDAQEFMQFLLDGLHEGLNRVITKPYTLIEDSNGRPDQEVASEHWDVHIQRNQSVIVDLFMGQLKSSLKWSCGRENVKFDPYSVLSLPLPLPEKRFLEVTIIPQESLRSPTKFSVQVKPHTSLWSLREQLASLCEIPSERLYLVEVYNNVVFSILNLNGSTDAIRTSDNVYGYEIPVVNNFDKTIVKPVTLDRKLLIGEKIDCLNGKNKWYKAKVMAVKGNRILVNFLGLPSKWDEWVPMNSSRIAPFESKTSLPPSDHLLHHARFENVLLPSNWICIHLCHRVLVSQKDYFINPVVPRLFGIPILLFIPPQSISYVQLYELVWDKVRRFAPTPVIRQSINVFHADDSALPPFVLSRVKRGGAYCSECSWTKMCLGHRVPFSSEQIDFHHNQTISIDWNILFYEKYLLLDEVNNILEHPSVAEHKELSQRKLHISDCMTLFTEIEELSGDSAPYCSSCKEMHLAQKSIELWSTPPIFIIHLKRLIHGSKLSSVVDFPIRDFDPSSFLVRDAKERSHCDKYDLYAVINHMGHSGAGHYVSYGFIPSENSWYCFDDDNVKKIDKTEVVSRHAYILCYAKKGLKIDDVLSAELRLKLNASLSVDEAALLDEKIEDGKGTWGMLRSWNTSVFKKFRPHQSRSKSPSQDSENITSTDSRECNMM